MTCSCQASLAAAIIGASVGTAHAALLVTRDSRSLGFQADIALGQDDEVRSPDNAGGAFDAMIQREYFNGVSIARADLSFTSLRTDARGGLRLTGRSEHNLSLELVPGEPLSNFGPNSSGFSGVSLEFVSPTAFTFLAEIETNAVPNGTLAPNAAAFFLVQLDGGTGRIGGDTSGTYHSEFGAGRYSFWIGLDSSVPVPSDTGFASLSEFLDFDVSIRPVPAPGAAVPLAIAGLFAARRRSSSRVG